MYIKNQTSGSLLPVFLTMLLMLFSAAQAAAQQKESPAEIKFTEESFQQVLATAKSTHKMIFVDAFATWCGPCKQMQKTTFKDARAAAYFNEHFINCAVNVEKGDGVDLAKRWQIEGLPTLLILDEHGNVLANHTGYVDGNGLIEFAREAFDE
jgi:thioredoxin 1